MAAATSSTISTSTASTSTTDGATTDVEENEIDGASKEKVDPLDAAAPAAVSGTTYSCCDVGKIDGVELTAGAHTERLIDDAAKNLEMHLIGSAAKLQAACNPEDTAPGAKRSTTVAKNPVFRTPKVDEFSTPAHLDAYLRDLKYGEQYLEYFRRLARDGRNPDGTKAMSDVANAYRDPFPNIPG